MQKLQRMALVFLVTSIVTIAAFVATQDSQSKSSASVKQKTVKVLRKKSQLGMFPTAQELAAAQDVEEREIVDKIPVHLPIKIKIKNPEKAKDLENDRWLADLEIEVKNTGTKPIYFLRLGLSFVDVKRDSGTRIGYSLVYGRSGFIKITTERPTPEDVPIEPGGTHVFKLHEDYVKGWNWYRTQVEKKPHPKKIEIFFSDLSHGDGTGYATNGGVPIPNLPKKKSSYENEQNGSGTVTAAAGCLPARPPDLPFIFAFSFLPAGFLPVSFSPAKAGNSLAGATPPQTCCPGEPNCQKIKLVESGNCWCPLGNPKQAFITQSASGCDDPDATCATFFVQYSECGEGETYQQCTEFFLDFSCGEEPPPPPPTPPPTPTPDPTSTPTPTPTPPPDCQALPQPAPCCACDYFSNLVPSPIGTPSYFPGWNCNLSYCPANQPLANGCVTPTLFQGIPICPPGYDPQSVYNDGICCPTPPPTPTPLPNLISGGGDPCTQYYKVTYWYWCPDGQNYVDGNCTYSHAEIDYAGCW